MKHHHLSFAAWTASLLFLWGCENVAMDELFSEVFDYLIPEWYGESVCTASLLEDNNTLVLALTQDLFGVDDRSRLVLSYSKLLVAEDADMKSIIATADASVLSTSAEWTHAWTVSGKVSVSYKENGAYYLQFVVGPSEDGAKLYNEPHKITMGAKTYPTLSTNLSKRGWYHINVSPGDINTFGWDLLEYGVYYTCIKEDLDSGVLGKSVRQVNRHYNTNDYQIYLADAAEDAGLDWREGPTYYIQTYAVTAAGIGYGPIKEFKTISTPTGSSYSVTDITSSSAKLKFSVTQSAEDYTTITYYVGYGTSTDWKSSTRIKGQTMSGLSSGTTYYYWPEVRNEYNEVIYWGGDKPSSFTTN